ncbi:MAG: hypothetical protein IMF05_00410 [Proteobacteria bacterium]|nr:hypothetical protein [Pseudomonadota bacterium]
MDWLPGSKPKPGHEEECEAIILALVEESHSEKKGLIGRLFSRKSEKEVDREALTERFHEISIPAYEALDAPRVGYAEAANEWAREKRTEHYPDVPEEEWLKHHHGYYVLDLAPPCDGLPRYTNAPMGYVEAYSFRAKFLEDCTDAIGDELFARGYGRMTAPELAAYGRELMACGEFWAAEHGIDIGAMNPEREDFDLESPEGKVDIILSAGRWCVFWGERGYILDPDF